MGALTLIERQRRPAAGYGRTGTASHIPSKHRKKCFPPPFEFIFTLSKQKSVILNLEVIYWPDCHSGF